MHGLSYTRTGTEWLWAVLLITDHFTKYAVAVPTKNQTAKTTADGLFNHFIVSFGVPCKLPSDQGGNFESDIIKELCSVMGIQKTRTAPYHPMCNGITERFNRTLISMIGTLKPDQKQDWKKYLPSLVFAYNSTKHESTKFSSFELMFGRKPKLPIDSMFESAMEEPNNTEYLQDLKRRLQLSKYIVSKHLESARKKQKLHFDKKAKACKIEVGDTVLVKHKGKHKIADKFEEETYKEIEQLNHQIPVFKVKSDSGNVRVLHRNHLLPISSFNDELENMDAKDELPKHKRMVSEKTEAVKKRKEKNKKEVATELESELEEQFVKVTHSVEDAHTSETVGDRENILKARVSNKGETETEKKLIAKFLRPNHVQSVQGQIMSTK